MLIGERVRLRAIEREDLPRCVAWLNDPEVVRYLTLYLPLSREDEERWFEGYLQDPRRKVLAIEAETGEHIGNIGLEEIDWKNRCAELGIFIGEKDRWGQGYGTDAVRTLLRFAFEELNLNRVQLHVFAFNERARRCYIRCGFVEEGRQRQAHYTEGRYHDVILMSILRAEWDALQADPCARSAKGKPGNRGSPVPP
ncbi:MAG: GNAT family N-acetyltransferase [Chloroflexia bacterium]